MRLQEKAGVIDQEVGVKGLGHLTERDQAAETTGTDPTAETAEVRAEDGMIDGGVRVETDMTGERIVRGIESIHVREQDRVKGKVDKIVSVRNAGSMDTDGVTVLC